MSWWRRECIWSNSTRFVMDRWRIVNGCWRTLEGCWRLFEGFVKDVWRFVYIDFWSCFYGFGGFLKRQRRRHRRQQSLTGEYMSLSWSVHVSFLFLHLLSMFHVCSLDVPPCSIHVPFMFRSCPSMFRWCSLHVPSLSPPCSTMSPPCPRHVPPCPRHVPRPFWWHRQDYRQCFSEAQTARRLSAPCNLFALYIC